MRCFVFSPVRKLNSVILYECPKNIDFPTLLWCNEHKQNMDLEGGLFMKKPFLKLCSFLTAATVLLTGCAKTPPADTTGGSGTTASTSASTSATQPVGLPVVDPAKYNEATISEEELYDKMMGGWLGQMIGVAWTASTEFAATGSIMSIPNGMVQVVAGSTGKETLKSLEIDMGDGFIMYSGGCYSYKKTGNYTLKYTFVSDKGTVITGEKTVKIESVPTGKGISSAGDSDLIFDGVTPYSAVAGAAKIQFEIKPASPDAEVWAGIQFDRAFAINGLKFVEGKQNKKGGWFTETPRVEVLIDGVWTPVASEMFPAYPGNSVDEQGDAFQQYRFAFDEVVCEGVRIVGKAGGTKMKATYLAGVGHSCWDQAYATSGLVDWLLAQSK